MAPLIIELKLTFGCLILIKTQDTSVQVLRQLQSYVTLPMGNFQEQASNHALPNLQI